jgi:hypothetical protein
MARLEQVGEVGEVGEVVEAGKLVVFLAQAVLETVAEMGEQGAPGGVLYAALMVYGIGLETFESIMEGLVAVGKLRRSGDLYYAV